MKPTPAQSTAPPLPATVEACHTVIRESCEPVQQLQVHLGQEPVRHVDETSHENHNPMMRAWTQVYAWGAYFRLDPSRGQVAAKALLGEQPKGVIVSDRYAGYNFIDLQQRQVCWAHLLRNFARIATREGVAGAIGKRLQACGYALFRWREQDKPAGHFERHSRNGKQPRVKSDISCASTLE